MFDLININQKKEDESSISEFVKNIKKQSEAIFICDYSGSMYDMNEGMCLFEHMNSILRKIQAINILAFADFCKFTNIPLDNPVGIGSRTDMAQALSLVKTKYSSFKKFILISDGFPNNPELTLEKAKELNHPIECIYLGMPNSDGYLFLEKLANIANGTITNVDTKDPLFGGLLEQKITLLLK